MARDYAKGRTPPRRGPHSGRKAPPPARRNAAGSSGGGWRWFGAGMLTGVFLSFLVYLGTLQQGEGGQVQGEPVPQPAATAPEPRFDFYTMLPEQSVDEEFTPREEPDTRRTAEQAGDYYLLQAGSFRQREDADRRRAELLLLGLDPSVQESESSNGRWFRVYLGPFDSHAKMARARSLTTAQGIETLLLKRPAAG